MTPAAKIMEIDISKLQPNTYNPRKTMDKKGLASLGKSLEQDGQLQTILVRPIESGKYEVVAGMRRYLSLKNIGEKKVMCTVQEMDVQTAMQRAFKENLEREQLNRIDEAGWFAKMLHMDEAILFGIKSEQEGEGEPGHGGAIGPPTVKSPVLQKLAKELNASDDLIEARLPLLALPLDLQMQVIGGDMEVGKAEVLAQLRQIGRYVEGDLDAVKKEVHNNMRDIWKHWGQKDIEALNEQVKIAIENAKEKSEQVLAELKTTEASLEKRTKNLKEEFDKVNSWLDSKSKNSLWNQLPKEVIKSIKMDMEKDLKTPDDAFDYLDDVINTITRDKSLTNLSRDMTERIDNLYLGGKYLEKHPDINECGYCGTKADFTRLKKKIEEVQEQKDEIEKSIEKKDALRDATEKVQRKLGDVAHEYDLVHSKFELALKTLVSAKKITKEIADEKREKIAKILTEG
jgi:thymidylate synthase